MGNRNRFTQMDASLMLRTRFLYLVMASILMSSGCFVTGRVTDENGTGVACIKISLSGEMSGATTTNSEGYYCFGDLMKLDIIPAGSYVVTPSKSGYTFTPASWEVTITTGVLEDLENVPWPENKLDFEIMTDVDGDAYQLCEKSVTLEWNASVGATGYKIYYSLDTLPIGEGPPYTGTEAAEGPSPVDVGNMTTYTLNFPTPDSIRFAVTAYNHYGESKHSREVGCP